MATESDFYSNNFKKRKEMDENYESMVAEINFLRSENQRLIDEVATLKESLVRVQQTQNDDDSDDDDEEEEESVCDGTPWSKNFYLLKEWKSQHGHCKVPRNVPKLGIFVNNTKASRRSGKLSTEQIAKLDKIGFHWGKGFPEPKEWNDYFQELMERKKITGNIEVYMDKDPAKMTELARWVGDQKKEGRRFYKGKPSVMTKEQYQMLDKEGFNWKKTRAGK
jgi:hypothetical protein